ncbi:ABC transporter permease [bacterium]|nr:ABC transporter permease [bacterium]
MNNTIGFLTLLKKETDRYMSVAIQTLFAPLVSSLLYLAIFGLPMKDMQSQVEGISYLAFLVPGLMMMGMINNSFQNSSSSLMISKYTGTITELLVLPISSMEKVMAFTFAAMGRGLIVGFLSLVSAMFFVDMPFHNITLILLVCILVTSCFSLLGVSAGIWAKNFDQMAILNQFILMPMIFLGGVFYSIRNLSGLFQKVSMFNPVLYMIDALRYAFIGVSDIPIMISMSVLLIVNLVAFVLAWWIFDSGYKLQS